MDLTVAIAKFVNFDYRIELVKDNTYGRKFKNNSWNGMIGEIIREVKYFETIF